MKVRQGINIPTMRIKRRKTDLSKLLKFSGKPQKKNEREHAEIWFKFLNGDNLADTASNLKDAAQGENYEFSDMYPTFAREAREEGFEHEAFSV